MTGTQRVESRTDGTLGGPYCWGMSQGDLATVRLSRLRAFAGSANVWRVSIDGQHAADLGSGDSCELIVYPGQHRIEVDPGWAGRNGSIIFTVAPGQVADFVIRPRSKGIRGGAEIAPGPASQVFGAPPPPPRTR